MDNKDTIIAVLIFMLLAVGWFAYENDHAWSADFYAQQSEYEAQLSVANEVNEQEFYRGLHAHCIITAQHVLGLSPQTGIPYCQKLTREAYNADARKAAHEIDKYQAFPWPMDRHEQHPTPKPTPTSEPTA